MVSEGKEVIYIDSDDEITDIISKINSSQKSVVALVLPKRAAVFQSVVNQKLLKKSAKAADKKLVLINPDSAVSNVAAVAGVYLAGSLSSKPYLPDPVDDEYASSDSNNVIEVKDDSPAEAPKTAVPIVPLVSVDKVAERAASDATESVSDDAPIEMEDAPANEVTKSAETAAAADSKVKQKKKHTPKIPDFGRFRLKVVGVWAAVILLVLGWFLAFIVMPKATIHVQTNSENLNMNEKITLRSDIPSSNVTESVLKSTEVSTKKSDKVTVDATGTKDVGEQASGTATMSAKICGTVGTPDAVPAGTALSNGNLNYITQSTVNFTLNSISNGCIYFNGNDVRIVAQESGDKYNVTDTNFAVSGRSNVSASGSASGGTSKTIKVFSDSDLSNAKSKLANNNKNDITNELRNKIKEAGQIPVEDSYSPGNQSISSDKKVGDEAAQVVVSADATYTMLGIKESELKSVLDAQIKSKAKNNTNKQIANDGYSSLAINGKNVISPTTQQYNIAYLAVLGTVVDKEKIASESAGKKRGEIESSVKSINGVSSVEVEYSPFWVTTTPKSDKKIKVLVDEE